MQPTRKSNVTLSDLVDVNSTDALFEEISFIALIVSPDFDAKRFRIVYDDMLSLYEGHFPGYKACNTDYHDLKHVLEVTLASARIAHSAREAGYHFEGFELLLLLVSAMMHDTGYIQPLSDEQGTGAKYTLVHVDKSIDFMRVYLECANFGIEAIAACSVIIKATDLSTKIEEIEFLHKNWEILAKIMASGDMLAQLADRLYLEKLLFLYREFEEGKVEGFTDELDLLAKTLAFYEYIKKRLENDLDGFSKHLILHFEKRWGIDEDLYQKALTANINYLAFLLKYHRDDYRAMLNRGSIVKMLYSATQGVEID